MQINENRVNIDMKPKSETQVTKLKSFHELLINNKDKWLCEMCQFLNSFQQSKCQGCSNSCRDKCLWMCSRCDLINHINTSICSACDGSNENVERFLMWKCWKPHCEQLNNPDYQFCKKCLLQRNAPKSPSDLVERKLENGKILKFWICQKCWKYNNDNYRNFDGKNCGHPRYAKAVKGNAIHGQININQKELAKDDNKIELNANQWQCEQCTLINENNIYQCPACKWEWKRNGWECWNVNCKAKNKVANIFCQECKLDRNPPDPKTKLVKDYAKNEIKEIWICKKCTKKNKKDDAKCAGTKCGAYKFYEGINSTNKDIINGTALDHNPNYDNYQKAIRNNENPSNTDSWKCWFINCKQVNNAADEFCRNCKLSRYGIWDRGALVKLLTKNGDINDIWICHKCYKYNELSDSHCGGKSCDISRF